MCRPGERDVSGRSTVTGIMYAVPRKPRRTHRATANRIHELFIHIYIYIWVHTSRTYDENNGIRVALALFTSELIYHNRV